MSTPNPITTHSHESHVHGENHGFLHRFQDYLGEFVYGGIDGSVTTFAVVSGAAGASLSTDVVIILGFANLIADGFAMSVGSYLSTRSEIDNYEKHKRVEYWEVDHLPEKERAEIREIYEAKGFSGELLEQVVDSICSDRDRWVDVMMKEELELQETTKSPFTMGAATFISFLIVGFIPLVVYLIDYFTHSIDHLFAISSGLTSLAFIGVGYLKAKVTLTSTWRAMIETLLLGSAAAGLSYIVGDYLEKLF